MAIEEKQKPAKQFQDENKLIELNQVKVIKQTIIFSLCCKLLQFFHMKRK